MLEFSKVLQVDVLGDKDANNTAEQINSHIRKISRLIFQWKMSFDLDSLKHLKKNNLKIT